MNIDKDRIYLSAPDMGEVELEYLLDAYKSNWIAPVGPHCDAFEKELAARCERKACAVLNSGTSAIHLSLELLGCGPGDIVLCQSFTFIGTVNPVRYCGATPYFIDSERDTWNMDPELLEDAIKELTSRNIIPRAIIPVHLYGMPSKIHEIVSIGERYSIPVIEDAAESLGASVKNSPCGSFGTFSILSFNGNKIITTSGGGALLADDEELIRRSRFLATQARDPAPHYEHSETGYNYRLSNLLAALGRAQLKSLDTRVEKRRAIHDLYKSELENIDGVTFHREPGDEYYSNRWLTTLLLDAGVFGRETRDLLIAELESHGIESRPLWKPMHMQPVFQGCESSLNGVGEFLFDNGICLPSGTGLSEEQVQRIAGIIARFLRSAV